MDDQKIGGAAHGWNADSWKNSDTDADNDEYRAFTEKFKPKKTTDDCYTPQGVYDAVLRWVIKEYDIAPTTRIMRPFYPGGDYQAEDYSGDCVVVDNPPFSILAQIKRWYAEHGIRYFLFAPGTSLFSSNGNENYVIAGTTITYENGANVNTSFATNMGEYKVHVSAELREIVDDANAENLRGKRKHPEAYDYPDNVITAARLNTLACNGVTLKIAAKDLHFTRALDNQHEQGKTLYGGGFFDFGPGGRGETPSACDG